MSFCNSIIKYGFYLLFILTPLVFFTGTSEFYEINKMWLVFVLAILINTAWIVKMIIARKVILRRTPLDIPISVFVISQVISTIFSLDQHTSFWGYYDRFNGGLISTIFYASLYFAFVANMQAKKALKIIRLSVITGVITAIWGIIAHFGRDPSCIFLNGQFNTSCWPETLVPTVRAFSTLGQPAWFAAYLTILLPVSMAYVLISIKKKKSGRLQLISL